MQGVRVGVALGGGGARGFAHVGVIKAIEEAGFNIVRVAGISMGAIIGAGYAHKKDIAHVHKSVLNFEYGKYVKAHRNHILLNIEDIVDYFDSCVESAYFADLAIPLKILTTDLRDMEGFIIESGKVATAMTASSSAPYIHRPIIYEGHQLVDGGLISDLPVELVDEPDVDLIIGVKVSESRQYSPEDYEHLSNFQKRVIKTAPILSLLWYKQLQSYLHYSQSIVSKELSKLRLSSVRRPLLIIEPNLTGISTLDFEKAVDAITKGYASATRILQEKILPNPS